MLRILVVDDDRNMRELLSLHLKHAGYEIQTAEDGIAAGYAVLYQQPDLIICDVIMPHMNGLEFVAALRADPVQQNIPVIFLTTAAEAEARGRELGAVGFLRKPVRADALLSFIAEKVQGGLVPLR
ncbi:MAG TPA: response regulator [Burkholderiales bacterium]|jgi:CheY-like chemotaxis protein